MYINRIFFFSETRILGTTETLVGGRRIIQYLKILVYYYLLKYAYFFLYIYSFYNIAKQQKIKF